MKRGEGPTARSESAIDARIPDRRHGGFTLVEVLIVAVILGILAALALPSLQGAVEKARVGRAIGDIRALSIDIMDYELEFKALPGTLADLGKSGMLDPWGNAYVYLPLSGAYSGNQGQARKDRFLVPLNSDFDLYSRGPDGSSVGPLTAPVSQDDIIRANEGGFVGVAENF